MSYDTLIQLLGAIPTNSWHSTASIHGRLVENGRKITKRSVERALEALSRQDYPPIECRGGEGRGKAKEWQWKREHPLQGHAHRQSALIEKLLLHRLAKHLLPPEIGARLQDEERRAAGEFAAKPGTPAAWWLEHVVVMPPGPQRFPKALEPGVFDAVSSALWQRKQLQVEYSNRSDAGWRTHVVNPQGLVQDGYLLYLVANFPGYDNVRHMSLARMRNPQVLADASRVLSDLDFRRHAAQQFDWPYDDPGVIEFCIRDTRKIELEELPISPDQKIDPTPDAKRFHRVTATVAPSYRLDTFLKSFGKDVRRIVT